MKKVLLFIVCSITMASCSHEGGHEGGTETRTIGDYSIKVIDGCEYIELDKGGGSHRIYSLTHKGNCINHEK
jgi:hypothetical protein